jgi:hypothetical protein
MAQGDKPDIKAEGDEQLDDVETEHLAEDPEKGPAPLGYGGKPGQPAPAEGGDDRRSTGRTVQ